MALNDYSQLQAAIRRNLWMRDDLSGQTPDWIALTEARCNNLLRVSQMEAEATITLTSGAGPLPADYLAFRRVTTQDSPPRVLAVVSPDWAAAEYPTPITSPSCYFTIIGTTIKTFPQSPSNLTLSYYQKIPALSGTNPTNWLLTRAPGVYLYGALLEAAPALDDGQRLQEWGVMFNDAIEQLKRADTGHRYNHAVMRVKGYCP